MHNPLTMKLEQFTRFDAAERERLDQILDYPASTFSRGSAIISDGQRVDHILLITSGLAARSKTLRDGNRQFMAFLFPGDLCDVEVFVLRAMDHDIVAMCETTCVLIPAKDMETLLTEHTNITRAMWWSTMADSAVLREWIVNHGSRDARARVAHLFCEMLIRYRMVGIGGDNTIPFPLSQEEFADATGITPVHLGRVLRALKGEALIEMDRKSATILDTDRLQAIAGYESRYLHLNRTEHRDRDVSDRAGDLVEAEAR